MRSYHLGNTDKVYRKGKFMEESKEKNIVIDKNTIKEKVFKIRHQKVMLDFELAEIYGYSTKRFNEQVKNNADKFDEDFMFQLSKDEWEILRSKNSTSNSEQGSGGRRYLPYAFTEQGIYMLMTVLKGELATKQSKALIRMFKQMKDFLVENSEFIDAKAFIQVAAQTTQNTRDIATLNNKISTLASKEDFKKVMDNFIDPNSYKHFLLMNGEKIEADLAYTTVYNSAKKSIFLIDNYIGLKTLELLRAAKDNVEIIVFSENLKNKDMLTRSILNDFKQDYPNIQLKIKNAGTMYHDRYLAIDYGTNHEAFYFCGASSKDAGNKISTISKIEESLRDMYHDLFKGMLNNADLQI